MVDPLVGRTTLAPLVGALWEAQDHAVAPFGITGRQGAILLSLTLGEATNAAELSRLYAVEMSSVTRMLDRMERKGLVARERSAADRRKVLLRITPAGHRLVKQALPAGIATAKRSWAGVTPAERRVLARIVAKVLRNLGIELGRPQRKSRSDRSI